MIIGLRSELPNMDLYNKWIFLRADLNVPLKNNSIEQTFRLQRVLPTINLILDKSGTIILVTHLGRPTGYDPALSTRLLLPYFQELQYNIIYAPDISTALSYKEQKAAKIILLENIRFWPQEYTKDLAFAQELKRLAPIYVNDAFATLHRDQTSITTLARLFLPENKTIGLLVEDELAALSKLTDQPEKPFMLILGGGKVADKLPLLEAFLSKAQIIALCPAIVFTFLKALDKPVGKSLIAPEHITTAKRIIATAHTKNVQLLFPKDFLVAHNNFEGLLSIINADSIPTDAVGISIGPKAIEEYSKEIMQARTIFFNAAMGSLQRPETLKATQALLIALAQSPAYTVVGGGDSVAAAYNFDLVSQIDYCSTGGGATLALLSGQELPGLKAISAF